MYLVGWPLCAHTLVIIEFRCVRVLGPESRFASIECTRFDTLVPFCSGYRCLRPVALEMEILVFDLVFPPRFALLCCAVNPAASFSAI